MSCIDISVCAVPDGRKADYTAHCKLFHTVAKELGALAVVDAWGEDVPEGKLTDFRKAVKAEPGETIAAGWIIWKDKPTRDAAWEKMMQDDAHEEHADALRRQTHDLRHVREHRGELRRRLICLDLTRT